MIGCLTVGTNDLDRAAAFCAACFRDADGNKRCVFHDG